MIQKNSTTRFSDRVNNYVKYRPNYPHEVINLLAEQGGLTSGSQIADIGSGTGIFTELLLNNSYNVYGVEPNEAMRITAENIFKGNDKFISVNGTAENTTLPDNTMDMIVCAQAFHWFKPDETKAEFRRILKDELKPVALIWNNRLTHSDAFAEAYDRLLNEKGIDYKEVNHQHLKGVNFARFFKDGEYSLTKFPNQQNFDFKGLAGRAFSSSYVPNENTAAGIEFSKLLKEVFDEHQLNGKVIIRYETEVYLGKV